MLPYQFILSRGYTLNFPGHRISYTLARWDLEGSLNVRYVRDRGECSSKIAFFQMNQRIRRTQKWHLKKHVEFTLGGQTLCDCILGDPGVLIYWLLFLSHRWFKRTSFIKGTLKPTKNLRTLTKVMWDWWVLHPRKLTCQGKPHHLKMYFLLKMGIFQCHVSFHGCKGKLWYNYIFLIVLYGATPKMIHLNIQIWANFQKSPNLLWKLQGPRCCFFSTACVSPKSRLCDYMEAIWI